MSNNTEKNPSREGNSEGIIIAAITWQESLLQAYRNYLLITQSIFMAVDVGLLSAQASATKLIEKLIFDVPFFLIFVLGVVTLKYLNGAIIERSKAVDWWQRRLLKCENINKGFGHFVAFRIAKEHGFKPPDVEGHQLDSSEIDRLLRAETPKARKVFGLFVPGFGILWVVLLLSAIINLW